MFGKDKTKNIVDLAKEFDETQSNAEPSPRGDLRPNPTAEGSVPEVNHIKDALSSLLENVQSKNTFTDFNLPSLGKFYPGYDKETIGVRPLKFSDEKRIQQSAAGDRALDALNSVLASCLSGPNFMELTIPDKLYCIYRLRQLSYGSTYTFPEKCEGCNHENEINYELSSMKINYLETASQDSVTVTLPDSGKTAVVKTLRVKDEDKMTSLKDIIQSLPGWIERIEEHKDRNIINLFVEGTTVRDVAALRKAIYSPSYGMDTSHDYFCTECGKKNELNVGINANFFFTS
tara:strand:+ start:112 stop:978 length:867 start_codon:yes stop_codon:yes gene_type:complete